MATTPLNIKIDTKLKKDLQRVAKKMGVPLSTAVTVKLRELARTQELHIFAEPPYRLRPEVEKELEEQRKDFELGRNVSGPFKSADELFAHLNTTQ